MSVYGNSLLLESAAWKFKVKDDDNYAKRVKKDKSWLEKIFNKCSEEAFKTFKESFRKLDSNDNYDKITLDEIDKFYKDNKKVPKVQQFDYQTDYIEFWYDGKYPSDDMALFYQDHVVKYIKKNEELKSKGYSVSSEDYIGIYIKLKSINESVVLEKAKFIDKDNNQSELGPKTNLKIEGVTVSVIECYADNEEILNNLDKDFPIFKKYYKDIFKNQFVKWLGISDEELKTIKLYEIAYGCKASGSGFCQFNYEYTYNYKPEDNMKIKNTTVPVCMEIKIENGKAVKSSFYDI